MLEDNDPMIRGEDEDPWSLPVSGPQSRGAGISAGGRRTGQGMPTPRPDLRQLDNALTQLRGNCVVVWVSASRFTYAAIFAAGQWFITGEGRYYDGNQFTHDRFVYDVLGAAEVTAIHIGRRFETYWSR